MNRTDMKAAGIKFGDSVYVNVGSGWSGFYTVTDLCGASKTIDIFVESNSYIPYWGVKSGVYILK
jgi:3D (Asp-Asp-Asp) domain-containing protein